MDISSENNIKQKIKHAIVERENLDQLLAVYEKDSHTSLLKKYSSEIEHMLQADRYRAMRVAAEKGLTNKVLALKDIALEVFG